MVITTVFAVKPSNILVNAAICRLGEVSFSAYLLHFLVLDKLSAHVPAIFDTHATGVAAIFACLALWVVAIPVTFGLASIAYRLVELPMIAFGRVHIGRHVAERATPASNAAAQQMAAFGPRAEAPARRPGFPGRLPVKPT